MKKYLINCVDVEKINNQYWYTFNVYKRFLFIRFPIFTYEGNTIKECVEQCQNYIKSLNYAWRNLE